MHVTRALMTKYVMIPVCDEGGCFECENRGLCSNALFLL